MAILRELNKRFYSQIIHTLALGFLPLAFSIKENEIQR